MRIVFCTKGDRILPSSRTRAHLIADYLRAQGYDAESHHIRTRPWWSLTKERFSDLRESRRILASVGPNDVLYLHKMTDQVDFMLLVLLRKWIGRRGFIFDFDDAIFLPTWNRAFKCWIMVKNADAVVVGSHYLQEYALKHNPRSFVISAPIDTEGVYQVAPTRSGDASIRIGWTGTSGHFENMKLLLAPLSRLVSEGKNIRFVQLGGGEKIYELMRSVPGLRVDYTPADQIAWEDPTQVVPLLQQFDIGVMPLQKTEQNRGKDAWKAKEYMGCGVATIVSDWGENPYVITNGVNGILADTEEDWYAGFLALIDDPAYRAQLGAAGRVHMDADYSYKAFMPKVQAILDGTATPLS